MNPARRPPSTLEVLLGPELEDVGAGAQGDGGREMRKGKSIATVGSFQIPGLLLPR